MAVDGCGCFWAGLLWLTFGWRVTFPCEKSESGRGRDYADGRKVMDVSVNMVGRQEIHGLMKMSGRCVKSMEISGTRARARGLAGVAMGQKAVLCNLSGVSGLKQAMRHEQLGTNSREQTVGQKVF